MNRFVTSCIVGAVTSMVCVAMAPPGVARAAEVPELTTAFTDYCADAGGIGETSNCDVDGEVGWTSLEDEEQYLLALDAASARMTLDQYGSSSLGRPLWSASVGDATKPAILIICSQHGTEPAPREMCLREAGRLALSNDADTTGLLNSVSFVFATTANPDGRAAGRRTLNDGEDPNRHNQDLAYPENVGMAQLLADYRPISVLDAHEMGGHHNFSIALSSPKNLNTDLTLRAHSDAIMASIADQFADTMFTTGEYEIPASTEQIMSNQIGLRHTVGGLIETRTTATAAQRVWMQEVGFRALAGYVAKNTTAIIADREAAMAAATQQGIDRAPVALDGAFGGVATSPGRLITDAPCGYVVDSDSMLEKKLALHEIGLLRGPAGRLFVSMAQPSRVPVMMSLDSRALAPLAAGTPVSDCIRSTGDVSLTATTGAAFTSTIATARAGQTPTPGEPGYAATVDWGDGTPVEAATVSNAGRNIAVDGSHTYTAAGNYTATVVADDGISLVRSLATIRVSDPIVYTPALGLSIESVPAGASLTVSGTGFAPTEKVSLTLHSEPVSLGTVDADAVGAFTTTVTVPDGVPLGIHTLVALGSVSQAPAQGSLSVVEATADPPVTPKAPSSAATPLEHQTLAATGYDAMPVIAFGLGLLLVGLAILSQGLRNKSGQEKRSKTKENGA
jgi:hypothetical protein